MKIRTILTLLHLQLFTFAVSQQSYNITFQHDGKIVFGTISIPDGSGPFPVIIINPGTGPNDRDGTLPLFGGNVPCLYPELEGETLKPYKELSNALVDSGFAVLRYDKLEFTYSPSTLGTITFHKLWLPVESAINYVKTRADIDTNRIILLGHSEGSSLIPFIAKNRSDIKALISLAGPRTPFDSILAYQQVHFTEICNGDTVEAQTIADQVLDYGDVARNGFCNGLPLLLGVSGCVWRDYFKATDSVAINYNLNNLPTLFLSLGLDINVPPSELLRFQEEVTITDDFWSIPGLIHFMTPNNDPHVSEVLTDTIIYWLREHNLISGTSENRLDDEFVDVYPNPFSDAISISLPEEILSTTIAIYDVAGQLVFRKENMEVQACSSINLNQLANGAYFLEITTDQFKISKKILKK
ncbi:MAG TPA: T9SS type A sorting domain-containing protein [Saprospiraceae bacterium]